MKIRVFITRVIFFPKCTSSTTLHILLLLKTYTDNLFSTSFQHQLPVVLTTFDSSDTPCIATHTRKNQIQPASRFYLNLYVFEILLIDAKWYSVLSWNQHCSYECSSVSDTGAFIASVLTYINPFPCSISFLVYYIQRSHGQGLAFTQGISPLGRHGYPIWWSDFFIVYYIHNPPGYLHTLREETVNPFDVIHF